MADNKHERESSASAPTKLNPKHAATPSDATRIRPQGDTEKDDKTRLKPRSAAPANKTEIAPSPTEGTPPSRMETIMRPSIHDARADLSDEPITKIERMDRTPRPPYTPGREIDVGSVIRGRFELEEVLGRGGMGAVYRAVDRIKKEAGDDNPYIAIKLLTGGFREHPRAFVTLQREAKKTQELAHPNIVTVYDFDRDDDIVYLTMEQLSGAPLLDIIKGKTDRFLSYKEKLSVIDQIAKGLAYAHSKGIVHSDLKPANLFLTDDNIIKILDFGIARAANQELYQDSFDAGELYALTLSYASPEMIRFEAPHPSDDIYGLGIIMCELLGGIHPFDRKDAKTALEEGLTPKTPNLRNPLLRKVIAQTLALQRDERIPDARSFLRSFHRAVSTPRRVATIAAAVVLAAIVNVVYLFTIEVEKVPFDSLPEDRKAQFHSLIEEGYTALRFQDLQAAVVKFNEAFEIHGNNKDIDRAKEKVLDIFRENLAKADNENSKAFFQSQIDDLREYPAFADVTEI